MGYNLSIILYVTTMSNESSNHHGMSDKDWAAHIRNLEEQRDLQIEAIRSAQEEARRAGRQYTPEYGEVGSDMAGKPFDSEMNTDDIDIGIGDDE